MLRKLEKRIRTVNAACVLCALVACGPSPRPVSPNVGAAWPTALGNERRAPFENEIVPDSLEVAWDENAGSGMRAPVLLTDSAVFVGTTNRQLLAFNTNTGRKSWDQRFEGEIPDQVVRSGRTLFFTTSEWNGRVHARDVERGKRVWRHDVGPARFSPLLEGGVVYGGNDHGVVFALRSENGEQIWRSRVSGSVAATLLNYGDALIAFSGTDSIYAIAKKDGAILRFGKIESEITAPPAFFRDTIVISTHSGAVFGISARTFQTLWRVDTGAPVLAAPVITSDGVVHVLNRNAEIWRISGGRGARVAAVGGAASASFTVARDRYVIGKVDGTVVVADRDGHALREYHFNDSVLAPVAVGGGALYVPLGRGRIVKLR